MQQGLQAVEGHGAVEPVALEQVGAGVDGDPSVVVGLDALGDHGHLEVVGEPGHGLEDDPVGVAGECVGDEQAIELELVDRQTAEMGEGGLALAEVVERESDAQAGDLVDVGSRRLVLGHEPFAELDHDAVGRDSAEGQCLRQVGHHGARIELGR